MGAAQATAWSFVRLGRGSNALGPRIGIAVATRPCLCLALLEIGAQLLGKPRLAVGLGRAA